MNFLATGGVGGEKVEVLGLEVLDWEVVLLSLVLALIPPTVGELALVVELLASLVEELDCDVELLPLVVELLALAVKELDCDADVLSLGVETLATGMELLDLQSPVVEGVCQSLFKPRERLGYRNDCGKSQWVGQGVELEFVRRFWSLCPH